MRKTVVTLILLIIGSFAFQGFQCTSPEMTTAKMKFQQKDFQAAEENVKKELKKNPKNEDAHILLAKIKLSQNEIIAAANVLKEAQPYLKTKAKKQEAAALTQNIFAQAYNGAIQLQQKYYQENNKDAFKGAIANADMALLLRPEMTDLYNLKGRLHESEGNVDKAIENYKNYAKSLEQEVRFAKETPLHLKMFRDEVINAFGKPERTEEDKKRNLMTDKIVYEGNDIFVSYAKEKEAESFIVEGFRTQIPNSWTEDMAMGFTQIITDPFAALADIYMKKENYDEAYKYANDLTILLPDNESYKRFKIGILQKSGKEDIALDELKKSANENPDNPRIWLQYADLLSNLGNSEEAVEKYKRVIELDPDNGFALFNLATTLKNIAAKIQATEQDKLSKDQDYEIKTELYFPTLKESAEYYKKSLRSEEFNNNYKVLMELANIYQVTEDDENLKETLQKLENKESEVEPENKRKFYLDLLKIYSNMQNEEKTKEISNKLQNLK